MKLFYILFVISTIMFMTFLSARYYDIKDSLFDEQNHNTYLVAHTAHTQLLHYEGLLELLGSHLLEKETYKDPSKSNMIYQSIMNLNREILGFGLIDTKGNYLALSSNLDPKKMPKLLIKEETKDSFIEALSSKNMVIGRTYYLKNVDAWVMPIRKAIYDKNGNVIALMTAGLKLHTPESFLNNIKLLNNKMVSLTRDADKNGNFYRNYFLGFDTVDKNILYNTPVPTTVSQSALNSLMQRNHITRNDLYNNKSVVSPPYNLELTNAWNKKVYASLSYNKRYKFYTLTGNDSSYIDDIFIQRMKIYFLLYLVSQLVFYLFFRYIAKINNDKRETLEFETTHDNLTKLPNKKFLYQHFEEYTQRHKKFILMYIDLDNFKSINDNFGHPIGDKLIQKVAQRIKDNTLKNDILIRDGGDEFILLKSFKSENNEKQYDELIKLIGDTFVVENMEFKLGSSIGISTYPLDSQDLTELLSMSDMAMYEAKKQKNTYSIYTNKLKEIQNKNVEIDQELRYALTRNEIFMVYQPQINTDGTLYGVEALVRWNSAKLGFVSPDKFIPIAEESNLIVELGRYITTTSIQEINDIQTKLNINFQLSINLSVKQLLCSSFINDILSDVSLLEGKFNSITFEITERLFIEDVNHVLPMLNQLKQHGFEISLDDFGTGYSSLSILKNLPIDELKIDKSFIDEIMINQDSHTLSNSIINIGHDLSMKTVAEGVETLDQVELLKKQKCDIFQGYYFSKPLTKEELISFIEQLS